MLFGPCCQLFKHNPLHLFYNFFPLCKLTATDGHTWVIYPLAYNKAGLMGKKIYQNFPQKSTSEDALTWFPENEKVKL